MPTSERIEDFYLQKFNQLPEFVDKKNGHFNVFSLKPFVGEYAILYHIVNGITIKLP
jgi:hypothetical protein